MPLISVPGSSIAGLLRERLGTYCDDRVLAYLTPKKPHDLIQDHPITIIYSDRMIFCVPKER